METRTPTRAGAALVGLLVGVFLVLGGFALGIIADRELLGPAPATTGGAPSVSQTIPTIAPLPTDTAAPVRSGGQRGCRPERDTGATKNAVR